jgi:hypothetical protein
MEMTETPEWAEKAIDDLPSMSHWNYRVVCVDGFCHLREIYYNENGEIEFWTEGAMPATGEDSEDIRGSLEMMLKATYIPMLHLIDNKLVEVNNATE